MKSIFRLLALTALTVSASSARADDKAPKITYDEHVQPIFREHCFACHNQDKARGGLVLHTYTGAMAGGASGAVLKPGDADGSRLFNLVSHKEEPHMPPKSPMIPAEKIDTIHQWLAMGALENSGSKAKIAAKPKVEIALAAATKGKPSGPPPMPGSKLNLEPLVRATRANAVTALASSPWAPVFAVAGQKQVALYSSDSLDLVGVLPFPEGVPYVLKFSRNGSLLLAGGGKGARSGRVVVWNVTTGERVFEVGDETDAVLAADISSDQTQIALGGPSRVIRVYSTRDGKLQREIRKHTDWVTALEFSPDAVLLASGDRSGGLYVWEAFTGREYLTLRNHTASITALSWRIDSNVLASSSEDTTIRLWEMENGGNIKGWGAHGGGASSVQFSKDGRLISCGRDRVAKLWKPDGALQRQFEALPDLALHVAFSHDENRVIVGDWSGSVRVWRSADGKALGTLSSNPPTLAERMEFVARQLAAEKADQAKLIAAVAASQAAAQKAQQALAAAQQQAKAAVDKISADKAAVDQNAADIKSLQARLDSFKAALAPAKTASR
jgi:Planctomycete cytochrome C/WD domain, G-beta repeat